MMVTETTMNVFVTGFGPFPNGPDRQFERNASHEITKLLPKSLAARSAINPTPVTINIVNPTAEEGGYVNVEYNHIRKYVKALHSGTREEINLYLHIGMAAGWNFVSIERLAFKQGMTTAWWGGKARRYYTIPDNIGQTIDDTGPCPWGEDVPMALSSNFDIDELVSDAQQLLQAGQRYAVPSAARKTRPASKIGVEFGTESRSDLSRSSTEPIQVKAHNEGGAYCCGFIHYESLANRFVNGDSPDVLFCHVPGETDSVSLQKGRDAIVAVIVAAVNELVHRARKV